MDKIYRHLEVERKWYAYWEKNGLFTPKKKKGVKPFTIVLPPPNANAELHVGHAMYVYEDIMIRYHRMLQDCTLWLPGADHAGFETQYVFEKHLQVKDQSRFDFDRETLFSMIWDFVHKNRSTMENQLRRLGFSLDWSRNTFTLDEKIQSIVYKTFKKLYDDKLIYRGIRLVNYCTHCGTGFSDLEVNYVEKKDPLYFMKYGPFIIATARPETKFRDTALAVNPKDPRYSKHIGKTYSIPGLLGHNQMTIIPDEGVDPKFGTGIMKVTPAHDPHDFELGEKFALPVTPIITFEGKMDFSWFLDVKGNEEKYVKRAKKYHDKPVYVARKLMVEDLQEDGLLLKVDTKYQHRIGVCYKCGTTIEPLPLEQWFVKVQPLAKEAIRAIRKNEITFVPKRHKKQAVDWLTNFHDWNISRQVVWGMRIPAWKCQNCDKKVGSSKSWVVTDGEKPSECPSCHGSTLSQDKDTFDTWFSSGQWPFATLLAQSDIIDKKVKGLDDFNTFYPTSVMETAYDILPWWVCRMIMLGIYATGKIPFETVYLHGLVRDEKGQKMSKSKGNVVNPLTMAETYGTDALRMALVYANAVGNDVSLSEDKIRSMRNFANKLWNIGRFIQMQMNHSEKKPDQLYKDASKRKFTQAEDRDMVFKLHKAVRKVSNQYESYMFGQAAETLYDFTWHTLADTYIEKVKERLRANDCDSLSVLLYSFTVCLMMLHPFMPFITEEINRQLYGEGSEPLIISKWPRM